MRIWRSVPIEKKSIFSEPHHCPATACRLAHYPAIRGLRLTGVCRVIVITNSGDLSHSPRFARSLCSPQLGLNLIMTEKKKREKVVAEITLAHLTQFRSEERRVGKECRDRR